MATILISDCDLLDLLSAPFNATTDFTVLADYCARFAETLIETDDPALRLALCGRLHAALALLQPTLHDPIPPHLIESLTVDTLPATPALYFRTRFLVRILPRAAPATAGTSSRAKNGTNPDRASV